MRPILVRCTLRLRLARCARAHRCTGRRATARRTTVNLAIGMCCTAITHFPIRITSSVADALKVSALGRDVMRMQSARPGATA